jgi:dihydropteroate synthase
MQEHIRLGGKLLDLKQPKIMGILNATPDSFFEASRGLAIDLCRKVEQMLAEGMDILDIGGYSTRPGAAFVTATEEANRIETTVKTIRAAFGSLPISVDTFRASVAEIGIGEGAQMINDISGGLFDGQMFSTIAKHKVAYVLMHCRGSIENLHQKQVYTHIAIDVIRDLKSHVTSLRQLGVADILIDPGFGFSKDSEQSLKLFADFDQLKILECPILVGISRKSIIWRTLGISAEQALNGTTALNMYALTKGCAMLRVHDIAAAKQAIDLYNAINK